MSGKLRRETVEFILDYIKDTPERQLRDMTDLDSKTIQVFSAASIVIGLAGLSAIQGATKPAVLGLLVDALVTYVAVAGLSVWHLFAKRVKVARFGDTLWEDFWESTPDAIRHGLVEEISRTYGYNKGVLKQKAVTANLALITTGLEVLLVACALVAARLP